MSVFLPSADSGPLPRISDSTFDSHVEYHKVDIPQGKDAELVNLKGPGKVTYFYIIDDIQESGIMFDPGLGRDPASATELDQLGTQSPR